MRKKKLLLLFWSIILIVAVTLEVKIIDVQLLKVSRNVTIEEYGMKIKYPKAYMNIEKEETNVEQIASMITSKVTVIENENASSVKLVEELVNAKSDLSGITMLIEGIKKDKTSKAIDEICSDYITMFRVYNESKIIVESNKSEVVVGGVPAGRIEIYVQSNTEGVYPGMISYLIPLDDREITISFTANKSLLKRASKEINKIISSIKFIEIAE